MAARARRRPHRPECRAARRRPRARGPGGGAHRSSGRHRPPRRRQGPHPRGQGAVQRQGHQLLPCRRRPRAQRRPRHRQGALRPAQPRHRLRRPQLRRRGLRRRVPARRRPARRLPHRRAQDLRARLRRHDLLGPRARHRGGPLRHHRAPAVAGRARPRGRGAARTRDRRHQHPRPGGGGPGDQRDPGPRLLLRHAWRGPRVLPLHRRPLHRPCRRHQHGAVPQRRGRRRAGRLRRRRPRGPPTHPRASRMRPLRRPPRARHRPERTVADLDAGPPHRRRHAPHLPGRGRHQLRHARPGPAAARLRRRQAHRPHRRSSGEGRRAPHLPR